MQQMIRAGLIGLALLLSSAAQDNVSAGHYEGTLKTPNRDVQMSFDIEKTDKGWIGTTTLNPGPSGLPLEKITVEGTTVSWAIGVPNAPTFKGEWDKVSKTLKGNVAGPGAELPIEFKRTGDAKVALPQESTPLTKPALGKWTGSVQTPTGQTLRLEMTLSNTAEGKGSATLVSVDQGNVPVPVSSIVQKGNTIELDVRAVGGMFTGTLNSDATAIDGSFTQSGVNMPIKFTRPAASSEEKKDAPPKP